MTCSIDGCTKTATARGWCPKHWARWRRNGDPLTVTMIYNDDEARFWSHVDKNGPGGCWLWTGSLDRYGYGRDENTTRRNARRHCKACERERAA